MNLDGMISRGAPAPGCATGRAPMKRLWLLILAGALASIGAELAVRLGGLVDFPVFEADRTIGYIQAANQSGAYLRTRAFRFNEYSMAAGPFAPTPDKFDLLLLGDSIVSGGNPYREEERLGPLLAQRTGWNVWPAAAGGWALQNALAYAARHPDVLRAVDAVAIVLSPGDLEGPASWSSEHAHPRRRPFPALPYVLRKHLVPRALPPAPADLLVSPRDWRSDLSAFADALRKPLLVLVYPDRNEASNPASPTPLDGDAAAVAALLGAKGKVVSVKSDPSWNPSLYRDAIHPTPEGNAVLAAILARGFAPQRPATGRSGGG
jgi:lysophospholipase L1-like esterase